MNGYLVTYQTDKIAVYADDPDAAFDIAFEHWDLDPKRKNWARNWAITVTLADADGETINVLADLEVALY